jgi:hypothetical protein
MSALCPVGVGSYVSQFVVRDFDHWSHPHSLYTIPMAIIIEMVWCGGDPLVFERHIRA